jgi:hypothetical protein
MIRSQSGDDSKSSIGSASNCSSSRPEISVLHGRPPTVRSSTAPLSSGCGHRHARRPFTRRRAHHVDRAPVDEIDGETELLVKVNVPRTSTTVLRGTEMSPPSPSCSSTPRWPQKVEVRTDRPLIDGGLEMHVENRPYWRHNRQAPPRLPR